MPEQYFTFSKKEQELMELFWDAGTPLARGEILERAANRKTSWKPNSVHILVNSLMEKGALEVAGYYLSSRKLGRTFQPTLTLQDYRLMQVKHAVILAVEAGVTAKDIKAAVDEGLK